MKVSKSLANTYTEATVQKSFSEISAMLQKAKATAILQEFDDSGTLSAISFKVPTEHGLMAFRFKAEVQKVYQVLVRSKLPLQRRSRDHAARVSWALIRDWLRVQLALIEAGIVNVHQVFLAYMQDDHGRTLYETLLAHKFTGRTLTDSNP